MRIEESISFGRGFAWSILIREGGIHCESLDWESENREGERDLKGDRDLESDRERVKERGV